MADFLGGLLSGGGGLYDDLLTPQQQSQLSSRGLLSMAGAFADAAMPSRFPVPLGAAIGKAAAAMGSGRDEAALSLLKAGMTAQEIKAMRQKMALNEQISPILLRIAMQNLGGTGGVSTQAPGVVPAAPTATSATTIPPGTPIPNIPIPQDMGIGPAVPSITQYGMPARRPLPPYTGLRPAALDASPAPLPMPPAPPGGRITPADYGVPNPPAAGSTPTPDDPAAGASLDDRYRGVLALAGRLGDGASGSSLPPPDQLIRQSGSPGGLLQASYTGAPPFGQTPGAGGDEVGSGSDTSSPEYLAKRARDLALVEKYESGGRNIEQQVVGPQGGYNPSVGRVTGPSSASGYRQMIDSTWRSAAGMAGIDTALYPRAIDAPRELQQKAAEALYDKRGLADWAPYNRTLARAVGWSGPMGDGGGSGGGAAPLATPPGAGAALATPSGGGVIPGTGMTAQQLGALNALTKMGGLGDPFNSLLETYYKSPGYLSEKTTAETKARTDIEDPINQRMKVLELALGMRKDGILYNPQTGEIKADPEWDKIHGRRAEDTKILELKYSKELKTFEEQQKIAEETRKDQKEIKPHPVYMGGQIVEQPMTTADAVQRLKDQTMRPGTYRDGDIIAKPIGNLSPDYQYKMSPTGGLTVEPIANTPAAEKAGEVARKKEIADRTALISRDVVVQNADMIEKQMRDSTLPTTGLGGSVLSNIPGTAAHNIAVLIQTVEARATLDQLNAVRAGSPTGGALGSVTEGEGTKLQTAIANLKQSQTQDQFLVNLRRMKEAYVDAVHGPGTYSKTLSDAPILRTVPATPPGATAAPADAEAAQARAGAARAIAQGAPREAVLKRLQDAGIDTRGF